MQPIIKDGKIYRHRNLVVVPYPSENVLASLYLKFVSDDILKLLFYQREFTLSEFLKYYTSPESSTLGCYKVGDDGMYTIAGMIWLNSPWSMGAGWSGREIGIGFSRGHDSEDILMFGRMCLEWAYDFLAVNTICAITPEMNRAARIFARRIDMEMFGPVPEMVNFNGTLSGAYIDVMTRSRWLSMGVFSEKPKEELQEV